VSKYPEDVGVVLFVPRQPLHGNLFLEIYPLLLCYGFKVNRKGWWWWRKWKIVPQVPTCTMQGASCEGSLLYFGRRLVASAFWVLFSNPFELLQRRKLGRWVCALTSM
jgi:hypothetical protein